MEDKKDYLKVDKIYGNLKTQKYVCISVLKNQSGLVEAWKFRGAFATEEEANAHAKAIRDDDPIYDVYVGDGFKWLLLNPDANNKEHVLSIQYAEERLQELAKGHEEHVNNDKLEEQKRKLNLLKQSVVETAEKDKKTNNLNRKDKRKYATQNSNTQVAVQEKKEPVEEIKRTEENVKLLEENINKLRNMYGKK